MLLVGLIIWLATNSFFLDRYRQLIEVQSNKVEKLVIVALILWILFTSFYACFHYLSFLFSVFVRTSGPEAVRRSYENNPPVAILYPCMNDIQENSIESCLAQDYRNYSFFVLDDSTTLEESERVNLLKEKYSDRISIIRRTNREGFKAGNLNNALKQIGRGYKYICVVDADELIVPTFLREMVAIAEGDENLGFIQGSHRQYGNTAYGKGIGDSIETHWNYFLPARNKFGFTYFYGHGALLRYESLCAVGGFPEVVSEDIALATRLREAGHLGFFAHWIVSLEEAPPSYEAFRRRNQKVISGTLEFLRKFYPPFALSSNVSIVEKVDLLISSSIIYQHVPFMSLIFLLGCLIPMLSLHGFWSGDLGHKGAIFTVQKWDFALYLLLVAIAPLCYFIPSAIRSPQRVMCTVIRLGAIQLSICLQSLGATLRSLMGQTGSFVPTGDRVTTLSHSWNRFIEPLVGLSLIVIGTLTTSLFLIAVGLSLVLAPIINRLNLGSRLSSALIMLPMLLVIIAVFGMPLLLICMTGLLATIAFAQP